LDGAAVRRWATTCCDALAAHRAEIDALNVFPVPDRDTGSNLLATMQAGLDAVLRDPGGDTGAPGEAVAVLARGALMGARGNSGVILSQVLRGLAEPLTGSGVGAATWDGAALREGLRRADELATAAVSNPVSGTVLTVLHAAAQAAAAVGSDELAEVAAAATVAAEAALADTPRQLPALATAGVVDAGGRGLTVLLDALLAVVTERPRVIGRPNRPPGGGPVPAQLGCAAGESASSDYEYPDYEYEVMYLLDGTDETRAGRLRTELAGLGDCVAVAGSGASGLWRVHVHCSDAGAAIEAGTRAGRPHRITVLRFTDQAQHGGSVLLSDRFATEQAVVVMVAGSGLAELLRAEGASTAAPSSTVPELLAVLAGTRARYVTVLAEPAVAGVAECAAAQAQDTGQQVVVLPAASPVQVLAAVAVHDSTRPPAEDLAAMRHAMAATRYGQLTVAGEGEAGELVARMLAEGGELVTVLLGEHAPAGLERALRERLTRTHPGVEVVVYPAGVPGCALLVGVE
jgi:DAK2 domain fusion protein YloV